MGQSPTERTGRAAVPPPRHSYDIAVARAWEALRGQQADQFAWLGARRADGGWAVPVLDDVLSLDLEARTLRTSAGANVGVGWGVLVLHYLRAAGRPPDEPPTVTFADLRGAQTYASVYQKRVIDRLCRTVGRDRATLSAAAGALGGKAADVGDAAWDFRAFPRVGMRLVWYAGDEELGPSASLLLPGHIEAFFCLEDVVVLSEGLVSRLSGGKF